MLSGATASSSIGPKRKRPEKDYKARGAQEVGLRRHLPLLIHRSSA